MTPDNSSSPISFVLSTEATQHGTVQDPRKLNAMSSKPIGTALTVDHATAAHGRNVKMPFILTGFTQDTGFRVFAFECTVADRIHAEYTVRADLALTRRYGIPIQELPLLCRALLERCGQGEQPAAMTFTEDDMRLHARACTDERNAAILRRKPARRPVTTNPTGVGWRAAQPHRP